MTSGNKRTQFALHRLNPTSSRRQ